MTTRRSESDLALFGGPKTRTAKLPVRRQFGERELAAIHTLFDYYREQERDFGYQDEFETRYTDAFVRSLGTAGFADAVSSGSAALFVCLGALQLPRGSEILVPAMSGDPGPISAAVLQGLQLKLIDSCPDSYAINVESITSRISSRTKAVLVVHPAGYPLDMEPIEQLCRERGLFLLEDCSQAHGAEIRGRRVGTFSDIAAFSTMYRKNHGSGGCGGIVFTRDHERYKIARAVADRGKPYWRDDFDPKNPTQFLFPALNFNQDELSCAIGLSTLARLDDVNARRRAFARSVASQLAERSQVCLAYPQSEGDAPFFLPIWVDTSKLRCDKFQFAKAIAAEGFDLNPHYNYIVSQWPWVTPYLVDHFEPINARAYRDSSFNILFNENYGPQEAADVIAAILKVEAVYLP